MILLNWTISDIDTALESYNTQKIYRSATEGGVYSEISVSATRRRLYENMYQYTYEDPTGSTTDWYKTTFFNSTTSDESAIVDSVAFQGTQYGYISLQDVRDEGFTTSEVTDDQVNLGIRRASQYIERVTRNWFYPRFRKFTIDGKTVDKAKRLSINTPIVAIGAFAINTYEYQMSSMTVYNRHLTQGLTTPDDRYDPMIAWNEKGELEIYRDDWYFHKGNQRFTFEGYFGFTDLGLDGLPGETADESQIPIFYGSTPELIKLATMYKTISFMYPMDSDDGAAFAKRGRITQEKTVDQMVAFSSLSGADASYGISGDIALDRIIQMYSAPFGVGLG